MCPMKWTFFVVFFPNLADDPFGFLGEDLCQGSLVLDVAQGRHLEGSKHGNVKRRGVNQERKV